MRVWVQFCWHLACRSAQTSRDSGMGPRSRSLYGVMVRRFCLFLIVAGALSGCASRGVLSFPEGPVPGAAVLQPVFVAANRQKTATVPDVPVFSEKRDEDLTFRQVTVSIPPVHQTGRIEWAETARADPGQHFVVAQSTALPTPSAFLDAIRAQQEAKTREVLVFVHGYNTNDAEGIYRLAQIAHDFQASSPVLLYSWPSAGDPRGYVYDRDSVYFSRDGLESLLVHLTQDGGFDVLLVAHSLGGQLVMETLRQLSLSGQGHVLDSLTGVGLISPDIDEDVFLRQAKRIAPFPEPFLLVVSSRDRVLGLSARLSGKPTRLGSISDPSALGAVPVEVVDLTQFQERGDGAGHNTAFAVPAAIERLRGLRDAGS